MSSPHETSSQGWNSILGIFLSTHVYDGPQSVETSSDVSISDVDEPKLNIGLFISYFKNLRASTSQYLQTEIALSLTTMLFNFYTK